MKKKLFDLLAGLISLSEFEAWLYHDDEIQGSILEDENTLQLCSIDLSKKHVILELKHFCFDVFDEEEFFVYTLEENSKMIIEKGNEWILEHTKNICEFRCFDEYRALMWEFDDLLCNYDDNCTYMTKREIIHEIKSLAKGIVEKFEYADLTQKIKMANSGFQRDSYVSPSNPPTVVKHWYQFWK